MINEIKKRKLVLNRETVMPLQPDQLGLVIGAKDHLLSRVAESAASGGAVSAAVTLVATESGGACAAASAAASAVTGGVDHVSDRLGVPCWLATSLGSAAVHWTRRL